MKKRNQWVTKKLKRAVSSVQEDGDQPDTFKSLPQEPILGKYWVVILDGTGLFHFKERHCENAATKRLLERIKKEYPRLKTCVFGDGLYGVEPLMKRCSGYGWKYIFSLKEGIQKNITKDYKDLEADMKHERKGLCSERGTGRFYNGVGSLYMGDKSEANRKKSGGVHQDRPETVENRKRRV